MKDESPKSRIIIIDKNQGSMQLLATFLEHKGFEVIQYDSFLKAIDFQLANHHIDLVIVMLSEPTQNFYDFPKKFHDRTEKKTPIFIYSGCTEKDVIIKSLQAGYRDYLLRPVDPEILFDKIRSVVDHDLNLSDSTFKFQMDEEAKLSCQFSIKEINDFGIVANFPIDFKNGAVIEINSPTLGRNDLQNLKVTVTGFIQKDENNLRFPLQYKLSFIGLDYATLTKVRRMAIFLGNAISK